MTGSAGIPPCAGVIGHFCEIFYLKTVFLPHVGLSVNVLLNYECGDVFPPHAGVIGSLFVSTSSAERIPPACGGYRKLFMSPFTSAAHFPRMRGLSEQIENPVV